jgi:hypothetical protein
VQCGSFIYLVSSWLGGLRDDVKPATKAEPPIDAAHFFDTEAFEFGVLFFKLRNELN